MQLSSQLPSNVTHVIQDNFIGISYELSSFDTLWGKTAGKLPVPMQNYLHNLIARMSKPLRVRVGGNEMDGSTYMKNMTTSMLELTGPKAYFNDIPTYFGPVLFDVLNAMYDKVGPMQYIVGLCMRNGHDFTNIFELAQDATRLQGDRLDSILLGNEPDLYAGHGERDAYEITDYIPELWKAVEALTPAGALTERVPRIGGPTACCSWCLVDVLKTGMDLLPYNYYTLRRYPNHACSGVNEKNTNITQHRTHANVEPYLDWNRPGMERAKELGVQGARSPGDNDGVQLCVMRWREYFANIHYVPLGSRCWAQGRDDGVHCRLSQVYLHTREHGIQYNLFGPPTPETSLQAGWRTGSPYYAALFLAELTPPDGNLVVDLDLNSGNSDPFVQVAGCAIYSANDRTGEKLVFINYDETDTQSFRIPANVTEKIEYRFLRAPLLTETKEIKWAGQTVGNHGNLVGEQEAIQMECSKGCIVEPPGPGAALIVLGESVALFKGNSTLVGYLAESGSSALAQGVCWWMLVPFTCLLPLFLY